MNTNSKIDALSASTGDLSDEFWSTIDGTIDRRLHRQTVVLVRWMVGLSVSLVALDIALAVFT